MDPYTIGTILGLFYWPALLGGAIYLIGWMLARPQQGPREGGPWFRTAAIVASLGLFAILLFFHVFMLPSS
jgi:hypothetical protein